MSHIQEFPGFFSYYFYIFKAPFHSDHTQNKILFSSYPQLKVMSIFFFDGETKSHFGSQGNTLNSRNDKNAKIKIVAFSRFVAVAL